MPLRALRGESAATRPPSVRRPGGALNAWRTIAAAARRESLALERALADPERQQAQLLSSILAANRDTAFGREHDFAAIDGIDAFRRAVPLRRDTDYLPWFDAAARGEPALTTERPVAFESTGGTSGEKTIPYTVAALDAFRAGVLPWLGYLLESYPHIQNGVAYVAVSPLTRRARMLPCGLPLGLPSDAAYLGRELETSLAHVITAPALKNEVDAWAAHTFAHLAARRDLTIISVWSPTFLLEILEQSPGPVRDLWPDLQVVSMWADGASAPYAARVAELLPDVALDGKGVLATESVVTVRTRAGCVPALTSAFLEFIDAAGRSHLAHELRDGTRYRVALTTPGGLYRYDLGDEFECERESAAPPTLRFLGRVGLVSDLVGEKLSDSFAAFALAPLDVGATLVSRIAPKPHYELWLDAATLPAADRLRAVEQRLAENPQYAYARALGQLPALEVVCAPGFAQRRAHERARGGGRLGDAKASALIVDTAGSFTHIRRTA